MQRIKIDKNKSKQKRLETPKSLLIKSWILYSKKLVDFIRLYLIGLTGLIPLLILFIIMAIFRIFLSNYFLELNSIVVNIIMILMLFLAILWAGYYMIRAQIGIVILIADPEKKAQEAFFESKQFLLTYLVVGLLLSILLALLFIAFIIPGIIFYFYWYFATMLVIVEGIKSIKQALKRSKELVKGYWWPVTLRLLLLGIIYIAVISLATLPTEFLNDAAALAYSFIINLLAALLTPFMVIYSYFLYKDLLLKK